MQKKIKLLIFMFLIVTSLYGQNSAFTTSVSLVGMSMDYKEYDNSSTLIDSEKSDFMELGGVEIGLGYMVSKEMSAYTQVNMNFMMLTGSSTYKGSVLGSGDPYGTITSTTQNTIMDMELSYKRGYSLSKSLELNYGLGFGYRYWERSLSASQVETYTWYSLRPMIGVDYALNNRVNIALELEYQYGINPVMDESTYGEFTLGGADIIELSLPISYKYNEKLDMFFEYVYQKQTIEKSNVVSGYIEPDSIANNQYLKLGMRFKF
jgi:hypothetical protein